MLSKEDNELVTRVGAGTLMGELMRQYWLPAMLSSELPSPDSDPVRVLLLGEKLIAFRDTTGRIGLMAHIVRTAARRCFSVATKKTDCGASITAGSLTSGDCLDMPNEPPSPISNRK